MADKPATPYPLVWPDGWPRTPKPKRASFQTRRDAAEAGLRNELRLLGATAVVISSNKHRTRDGTLAQRQPLLQDDSGVAVYFTRDGTPSVMACDRWTTLADNLQALRLSIAALRGLDRWGSSDIVGRAFEGFRALPVGGEAPIWWEVLEVPPTASGAEIDQAYRRLAKRLHPDVPTGNREQFERVTAAYEQAKGAIAA